MNAKKAVTYLAFLGIGALLFYLAAAAVEDWDALKRDMQSASWPGIAASFVMGYLAIVSRGMRWLLLLDPLGHKPKGAHSVHAVAFAYFANTFVPRSGELARCAALNQTDNIPVDQLFGTVISERVIDFVFLFLLTAIAVVGNLDAFALLLETMELPAGQGLFLVGGLGVVGAGLFWAFRKPLMKWGPVAKVVAFLLGVWEGLISIRHMRRKGLFIAHTAFIWTMYFLMAYVIFQSIDRLAGIGVLEAVFVMVAGGFGMVMPAPGGIGAYHWAVKLAFVALGYEGDLGFAVANVVWFTQTAMIILTGGIAYLALLWFRVRKDQTAQ